MNISVFTIKYFSDKHQDYDDSKISQRQISHIQRINVSIYFIGRTLHTISRYPNDFFDKPSPIYYKTHFFIFSTEE